MAATTGVKLDEEMKTRLRLLGQAKNRTPHWLMRKAIMEYLEREEALEARNCEADTAWEEYKMTGKGVPHEVMLAWFDDMEAGKNTPCPEPQQL